MPPIGGRAFAKLLDRAGAVEFGGALFRLDPISINGVQGWAIYVCYPDGARDVVGTRVFTRGLNREQM